MICYLGLLLVVRLTWDRIDPDPGYLNSSDLPGISVVIAVRNEEEHIAQLAETLDSLQYPEDKLEIIIVDDASEDHTAELLERHIAGKRFFRWFTLYETSDFEGSYKKRALTAAIESAVFPIIVTTDGDCSFHPNWLKALITPLQRENLQMVTGPVKYLPGQRVAPLLDIEIASLMAVGGAFLELGRPNMCNGANLAFTREAFQKVKGYQGYDQIVSGDDEFLLYKIFRGYPGKVRFVKNTEAVVNTAPPKSWTEFINQRKRWSSKWKAHRSIITRGLALFIFVFHLCFTCALVMTLGGWYSWKLFLLQLAAKILMEHLLVSPVLEFQGKRVSFRWFLLMQLLYSLYVVVVGFWGQLSGFSWKNRRYQ